MDAPSAAAAVIQVTDLCKTYSTGLLGSRKLKALRGVSFEVQPGEIFGLLGPNGAGKTTIIKILLGIARRTAGEAYLMGRPAGSLRSRREVGYLPERLRIPAHHTARSTLAYFGRLSGMSRSKIKARSDELLELVGLADRARERVKRFSKGMQQRLGLAQALMHDPKLLILDEPTDGLDPVGRSDVRAILRRLKEQGCTVFLNSHLLQEVELVCDRVAIMQHGQLLDVGAVEEIARRGQPDGVELRIQVLAAPHQLESSLAGYQIRSQRTTEDGTTQLVLVVPDQAAIDQCVDRLRSQEVSILSLARHRMTLEEAFLNLLQANAAHTDSAHARVS